ncbi:hypothetical protein [Catellatospora vulcania]|uniref:hypothetical protein n=1 Tax=Catellatospora vulcania TaxID=1460450 RepID=UPI0012D45C43|nr:hypothetical protein [Catellatospora vulcania]
MADLFTRLTEPGGVPGAITPRVQTLFEGDAAPPDPRETADGHEHVIAAGPGTVATAAPVQAASPRPPAATPITPGPPAAPPPGAARFEHPQRPARVEPTQDAPRPDGLTRHLETTARQAEGGDIGRLRPRQDAVPAPTAPMPTRAEQRSGAQTSDRRAPRAETVTAPQPPAVNISIGRIEVRAIPAPQPPAAAIPDRAGEPQGLTLAQYLRGDDGRPR